MPVLPSSVDRVWIFLDRLAIVSVLVAATCAAILVVSGSGWAQTARTGTPAADVDQPLTVSLFSAGDFDSRVTELLGQWAGAALRCKPYLVIVSNDGPQTVVAYSVAFEQRRPDGSVIATDRVLFMYPTAVSRADESAAPVRPGRAFRPGEERVVGRGSVGFEVFDPSSDNSWLDQLCADPLAGLPANDDNVVINAVVLDDGTFHGDPSSRLIADFPIFVDVTQRLYRDVVDQLARGGSLDEVFSNLQGDSDSARQQARESVRARYYQDAVGDLRRWRREIGDAAFREALLSAIRSEEFRLVQR